MLGGSGETPRQCLHQETAPIWALEEQLVKEHPGQCRSGRAWQQSRSGRAPEGKVCPPKATWHHHPATHPTASWPSHLPGLADLLMWAGAADRAAQPLQPSQMCPGTEPSLWDGAWGGSCNSITAVAPSWWDPQCPRRVVMMIEG